MLALIQRKVEGEDITLAPTAEPEHKIIDIMEALKASLAAGNSRKPAQAADEKSRPPSRKPPRRSAPRSSGAMKAYSTREVAELLGLSPARVRSLLRSGVVNPQRSAAMAAPRSRSKTSCCCAPPRGSSTPRCRRGASRKHCRLSRTSYRSIGRCQPCACRSTATASSCATTRSSWEPESKQTVLDFSIRELGDKVAPIARESVQRALRAASTADDLFQAALESEADRRERPKRRPRTAARSLRTPRTSRRTSTWAGCGTSARRSTKRKSCIGAHSSSSRITRPHASTWASCSKIAAATAEAIARVSRGSANRSARRRRALQSRAALSADGRPAGGAAPFLTLPRSHAQPYRLTPLSRCAALTPGHREQLRRELRPCRAVLVLEEDLRLGHARLLDALEPQLEIRGRVVDAAQAQVRPIGRPGQQLERRVALALHERGVARPSAGRRRPARATSRGETRTPREYRSAARAGTPRAPPRRSERAAAIARAASPSNAPKSAQSDNRICKLGGAVARGASGARCAAAP